MRKVGLAVGLALVGFACGGAEAQEAVFCDNEYVVRRDNATLTYYWAEFQVKPGATEVTVCYGGDQGVEDPIGRIDRCGRSKAPWFLGTTSGYVSCGVWVDNETGPDSPAANILSITVHR